MNMVMGFADCARAPAPLSIGFGSDSMGRNMPIGWSKGRIMAVGLPFDMLQPRCQVNW